MQRIITSAIFALAAVIAAWFIGSAYVERGRKEHVIRVTGLGKTDFTADLIVWEGTFYRLNASLQQAYSDLARDKALVEQYLLNKGVDKNAIVFSAISLRKETEPQYSLEGKYIGERFIGYSLQQRVRITSREVEKIEQVAREITELLNKGVQFYSYAPRYYYTKLEDLKLDLIAKATENARKRAEQIVSKAGGRLGKLIHAKMGVFQITGRYSDEEYSWGGTYNTTSKEKTASITVRLTYILE